ncbi:unnamed protein product [Cylicocyclus nassatus]|uniref:Uncharacterized protein n=1 Tax=Cylicocyclus nassatus TaxID=53992 RepID=A0AA36H638_CYLNA|nr:unnamed protein product [Cylicocyclus nassatus]
MGIAVTSYLMLLEVLMGQGFFACPCAQLLPSPCTCQAGFMPFCTCTRTILKYSCPCSTPPPPCRAACQRTCTSMCARNGLGPRCPSYCGFSCLQSCMHQQAVPIQIVMNRLVAPLGQCIPFCRKNCERSCIPMVSTATCIPLCKQPCEQKCSQFTPTGVKNFEKVEQSIHGLIAPSALLTQSALLPTISQKEPNGSSTSTSSPTITTFSSQSTPREPTLIPSSAFETTSQPQTAEEGGAYVDIPIEDSGLTSPTDRMTLFEEPQQFNDSTTPETSELADKKSVVV